MQDKDNNLVGRESVLNVEAQKELIDYRFKKAQSYVFKTFLIVFGSTILLFGIVFGGVFYYASSMRSQKTNTQQQLQIKVKP